MFEGSRRINHGGHGVVVRDIIVVPSGFPIDFDIGKFNSFYILKLSGTESLMVIRKFLKLLLRETPCHSVVKIFLIPCN